MLSDNLRHILVLLGMAAGLLAYGVPGILLARRTRSRRHLIFCLCWCTAGGALMFGLMAASSIDSPFQLTYFLFMAVFQVTGMILVLLGPPTEFPGWVEEEPSRRVHPVQEESRVLTLQEAVAAYGQGDLRLSELVEHLGRGLPNEDAAALVASLGPEIRAELRNYVEDCPQTEEAWSRNCGHRFVLWGRRVARQRQGVPRQQVEAELAQEVRSLCRGVQVLRDGINPFLPGSNVIDPCLLAWKDDTIPRLAQAIRDEEAFERLPILADALEDAGCSNEQVLEHLRGPGPHHRSCWCLALVLDR
jgi:hypothetical protein